MQLKRDFPRIPFYTEFWRWTAWGKTLMDLHCHYENAEPLGLTIKHRHMRATTVLKPILKARKTEGKIEIDQQTSLYNIPETVWNYQLGHRSAVEWLLDGYKEKKLKDITLADQFNTYRFADYKTGVIDLLQRICTVSIKTMAIVEEMRVISHSE